jgi:hypothetical protein
MDDMLEKELMVNLLKGTSTAVWGYFDNQHQEISKDNIAHSRVVSSVN